MDKTWTTDVCGTYFPAGNTLLFSPSSLTTQSVLVANTARFAIHESGLANKMVAAPRTPSEYPTGCPLA